MMTGTPVGHRRPFCHSLAIDRFPRLRRLYDLPCSGPLPTHLVVKKRSVAVGFIADQPLISGVVLPITLWLLLHRFLQRLLIHPWTIIPHAKANVSARFQYGTVLGGNSFLLGGYDDFATILHGIASIHGQIQ